MLDLRALGLAAKSDLSLLGLIEFGSQAKPNNLESGGMPN